MTPAPRISRRKSDDTASVAGPPLPLQLLRARDAVMQRFRPHLRAVGLTDQQGRILRTLATAGRMEMTLLAERSCIHPASLSRIVPRLDRKGVVRRWKHPTDARRVFVSITREGRALIATIIRQSTRIYAELAAELGSARMRELHRCLDMLIQSSDHAEGAARTTGAAARSPNRARGRTAPRP